jgi:hypothetical protein
MYKYGRVYVPKSVTFPFYVERDDKEIEFTVTAYPKETYSYDYEFSDFDWDFLTEDERSRLQEKASEKFQEETEVDDSDPPDDYWD